MQNVAVDVIAPKMLERTGHRLSNLIGKAGGGIVGQTMILAGLVGEFRLEKNIGAGDYSVAIGGG